MTKRPAFKAFRKKALRDPAFSPNWMSRNGMEYLEKLTGASPSDFGESLLAAPSLGALRTNCPLSPTISSPLNAFPMKLAGAIFATAEVTSRLPKALPSGHSITTLFAFAVAGFIRNWMRLTFAPLASSNFAMRDSRNDELLA